MDIKGGFSKQLTKINLKTSAFMEENKIDSYIASLQKEIGELKKRMGERSISNLWIWNISLPCRAMNPTA